MRENIREKNTVVVVVRSNNETSEIGVTEKIIAEMIIISTTGILSSIEYVNCVFLGNLLRIV